MKSPVKRRVFLRTVIGAVATAGVSCRLRHAPLPSRTFVIEAPPASPRTGVVGAGVLLVRPFRVTPAYESRAFVIRRGESEFTADPYHAFLLSPASMVTEAIATWIRGLGVFATVSTGGSQLPATHALEGDVDELYGDYRAPGPPKAHLAVQLRLLHPVGGPKPVVQWQREERRAVVLSKAGPQELVAGWNQALSEILHTFEPDFGPRMEARSSRPDQSVG